MANKTDRFYFDNLVQAADCACRASQYLAKTLADFDPATIRVALSEMHGIEHEGDDRKHDMSAALAKAFVTPVDREDLALISQTIDDVTDTVEEVLRQFYLDKISLVLPEALTFSNKLVDCCTLMRDMLSEFSGFKRSRKLREMIIALNRAEEECDALYLEAILAIPADGADILPIIYWREIYACMESCADACEHVGDCVETVVMKNT